jgi:hypothetical protein
MVRRRGHHTSRRTKQPDNPKKETVAKWRSLIEGLESETIFKSQTSRDRKRRLLKIREEITQIARNQVRFLCNCQQITVAQSWYWQEFEAKMKISCPIHGPCRLGMIVPFMGYASDRDPRDRRLAELLREYDRRCVSYQNRELKHDEN